MNEADSSSDAQSNYMGIVLILLAVALLSTMDATVKTIIEGGLSVMQMLAMRSWLVLPLLLVWMVANGGFSQLATDKKGLHFLRVLFGFGAPFFFFNSLTTMELAEATVIFFSSTFIMTALSIPILKEKVGIHRWSSIAIGFIGIVVATNPSGEMFDASSIGIFYATGTSISYSLMMIITRLIGNSEGTFKMLFFFHAWIGLVGTTSVMLGIGGLSFKPMEMSLAMNGWGGIGVITALVIVGHYCMMRAFSIAPIGLIAPFDYSALLWSTFFSYIIWDYVPGLNFWAGAMLVVASGIYIVMREIKVKKLEGVTYNVIVDSGPVAAPVPPSVSVDRD